MNHLEFPDIEKRDIKSQHELEDLIIEFDPINAGGYADFLWPHIESAIAEPLQRFAKEKLDALYGNDEVKKRDCIYEATMRNYHEVSETKDVKELLAINWWLCDRQADAEWNAAIDEAIQQIAVIESDNDRHTEDKLCEAMDLLKELKR